MATMKISTTRFGTVEVDEKNIIQFVGPILGFEQVRRYVLLDHAENSPFKWLQSVDNPELAFVVTNPKFFSINYEFMLPDDAVDKLAVEKADDVLVFTIVNIPHDNPAKMTANLLAPIVVNQVSLKAMQVVLQDAQYNTRTRLIPDKPEERLQGSTTSSAEKG